MHFLLSIVAARPEFPQRVASSASAETQQQHRYAISDIPRRCPTARLRYPRRRAARRATHAPHPSTAASFRHRRYRHYSWQRRRTACSPVGGGALLAGHVRPPCSALEPLGCCAC
jgi:hypothetical protein